MSHWCLCCWFSRSKMTAVRGASKLAYQLMMNRSRRRQCCCCYRIDRRCCWTDRIHQYCWLQSLYGAFQSAPLSSRSTGNRRGGRRGLPVVVLLLFAPKPPNPPEVWFAVLLLLFWPKPPKPPPKDIIVVGGARGSVMKVLRGRTEPQKPVALLTRSGRRGTSSN